MRLFVLALALLPANAIAEEASPSPKPPLVAKACRTKPQVAVKAAPEPARPSTLAEEPKASTYRPVVRLIDGCEVPVKISDGVGDTQR